MTTGFNGAVETARPLAFDDLPGWSRADHGAAWTAFRESAGHVASRGPALRDALAPPRALQALCERVAAMPIRLPGPEARHAFEEAFVPFGVTPDPGPDGFLTGYYEPLVGGSLGRSDKFTAPVLSRPAGWDALRPEAVPDRAALEDYAVSTQAKPVVWLRDWTELFLIHVQGSARVVLADGSRSRLVYAGRNGLPYTSIGRRLIESGRIARDEMSLDRLKHWLRQHGQEVGQEARRLMQENRSYIFFRLAPEGPDDKGPTGGQGLPLRANVSIAVDRTLWPYGLPFFLTSPTSLPGFGVAPFSGLFVAQDTGSAIVGPARADLYLGSGDEAGVAAGLIRHPATFTVLLPRAA